MENWKNVLLGPEKHISHAIEILEKEEPKIVLVVDNELHLLGTITDGDVRRALIRQYKMDTPIHKIMQNNPVATELSKHRDDILELMKQHKLLQIPLVDKNNVVCGLETYSHLSEPGRFDNPVFLMAGGFGKRLHPLTLETPKPLLKLGNKPILEMILESFVDSGFHRFIISTHYKGEQVIEHFKDGMKWDVSIEYIEEKEPLGTAGALGMLPKQSTEHPLIVMNGDVLTKVNYSQLLRYHHESGSLATMCVREYDFQVPYGVIETDGNHVKSITEKPIHSFFVNAGIYVLDAALYNNIPKGKYLDMPDLLQSKIAEGSEISIYPIHEYWLDIGKPDDFNQAKSEIEMIE